MKFLKQVLFAVLSVGALASVPASAVVIDTDHAVTKVKSTATKVKNFVNEHKVEIGLGVAVVGILACLGGYVAYNKFGKTAPAGATAAPKKPWSFDTLLSFGSFNRAQNGHAIAASVAVQ